MGAPEVQTGSVVPQARRNAARRARGGELMHITNARGAKYKLPGQFNWRTVPAGGVTVQAGTQIRTATRGGRARITSKSGGVMDVAAGSLTELKDSSQLQGPRGGADVKMDVPEEIKRRISRPSTQPSRQGM